MKSSYVMYDGHRNVVGLAYVTEANGKPAQLTRLFVSPEHRGKGHGRALLKAITTEADREYKNILLSITTDPDVDLARLVKFFLTFGFEVNGDTMIRKWRQLPRVIVPNIPQSRGRVHNGSVLQVL